MDTNKMDEGKARQQQHKNAASNFEQVLEATRHKTMEVRRTRYAGHCWWSRDELISNIFLWTLVHGRAKAGWPAKTYIGQLCEDTGCSPEYLPEAMNDREEWRERVRDIRAGGTRRWRWWWWWSMETKLLSFSCYIVYALVCEFSCINLKRNI